MDIDIKMELDLEVEDLIQECRNKTVLVVLQRIDEDSSIVKLSEFDKTTKNGHRIITKYKNNYLNCEEPNCTETFKEDTPKAQIELHKFSHQIPQFQYHWNRKECPICKKVYNLPHKRRDHVLTHNPEYKGFNCQFCDKRFCNLEARRNHESKHLNTFTCSQCNFTTKYSHGLKEHTKTTHEVYKCQYLGCNLTFIGIVKFEKHKAKEHDEKYICKICFKLFDVKTSFQKHLFKYHKQLRCDFENCDEICETEEDFAKHKAEHDPLTKPSFECNVCLKLFWTKSKLNTHFKKIHIEKEKIYNCTTNDCKKSFKTTRELEKHVKSHEKEKSEANPYNFGCAECGNIFTHFETFQRHMEDLHINPNKFICDYPLWTGQCGIKFRTSVALRNHKIQKHNQNSELRPHKCDMCGKSYTSLKNLQGHIKSVHKKEKDFEFKCTFEGCFDSFVNFKPLQNHIEKVHKNS